MVTKSLTFIALLAAGAAPAVAIASQFADLPGMHALGAGAVAAKAIAAAAPAVVSDAALAGVTTPVALAAALAFLAPPKDERLLFGIAMAICLVGWAAYLWMETVLGQTVARDALTAVLDQDGGEAATQAAYKHVANFAVAGRIAYLALAAALLGITFRAKGAAASAIAAAILLGAPGQAGAGSLKVSGDASAFDWRVGVREAPDADPNWLAPSGGAYAFAFDASLFASGSYVERILVLEWKPKAENVPASGVQTFVVEIPLLLRKWRADETRSVEANPFVGVGEAALRAYERSREPSLRWTRFLASLQQATHYANRVSPESALTRRALNTAVSALTDLSRTGWVLPPDDLRDRLAESFKSADPKKFAELTVAVDNIESALWTDLNAIETALGGETCEAARKTFEYLARRKSLNERAYVLQVGAATDLLDLKRAAVLKACPAARDGAGPSAGR